MTQSILAMSKCIAQFLSSTTKWQHAAGCLAAFMIRAKTVGTDTWPRDSQLTEEGLELFVGVCMLGLGTLNPKP